MNNTVIDSTNVYNYVYQYKDHLGNVRMSWTQDLIEEGEVVIMEENHYYPYGLKHTKYNADTWSFIKGGIPVGVAIAPVVNLPNQYKYNGKEWQGELALNMYAMDLRQYDPAIARWVVQDPVVHHSQTTYNAFDSNPVFWADPSGADAQNGQNENFYDFYNRDALGRKKFNEFGIFIPIMDRQDDGTGRFVGGGPMPDFSDGDKSDISPLEAALLAQHVYGEGGKLPQGWSDAGNPFGLNLTDDGGQSGLSAKLYQKVVDGKTSYALVYAGTQDLKKDGLQDVLQAFGKSKQYDFAVENGKKMAGRNVTFIGHSLGGGLAQASALASGGRAITFNPAWLSGFTREKHNLSNRKARINNFIIAGEILDVSQMAFGRSIGLSPSGTNHYRLPPLRHYYKGPIGWHMIGVVLDALPY